MISNIHPASAIYFSEAFMIGLSDLAPYKEVKQWEMNSRLF